MQQNYGRAFFAEWGVSAANGADDSRRETRDEPESRCILIFVWSTMEMRVRGMITAETVIGVLGEDLTRDSAGGAASEGTGIWTRARK